MRISDWSSDVCSSDLARLAQIIAAAAIAAGPEAVEIGVVVGLPGHPDLRIEGVPAIAIVEGVAGAILEDDRAARDCGGKDSIDKSEEHTSELQSLMRISYAVFCLKKINNTQQYNEYIHTHNKLKLIIYLT